MRSAIANSISANTMRSGFTGSTCASRAPTGASGMLQMLSIGQRLKRFPKGLKDRFRPLVRCAQRVKPQRHFSFGKRIGQTFTET